METYLNISLSFHISIVVYTDIFLYTSSSSSLLFYYCYIDCFLPWTKSVKDLELVHAILNNLHKDLNFTLQYSMVQQPFLDVLVKNNSGKIEKVKR